MVKIRLTRVGLKKQPSYRIIVTDSRKARDSRYIEVLGYYNPRTRPQTEVLDEGRALHWLNVGAQPSEAVERIMKRLGTLERFERYRAGEELETLVKEAEASRPELPEGRTNYPAPGDGESKQKAREAAALAAEEAAAAAEAKAEEAEEEAEPEASEA